MSRCARVYVLMRGFPGTELLIWVGLFMVFYGIVYALLENDMRRILAYSIVNQVGFMVAGIGIGTEMALNGAAAHAFTHIIYKALLLMSAGAVLMATGRRKCSELGGLFHSMPLTTICGTIGALAISSFPLTPEHEWPLALSRARGLPLDGVEMIGIVASVVLVTWMLRDLMPASDLAAATMLNVMRFFLAIPLLALFVGPFMLRRTRRGLETLRQQRESTRETKTSLKQISHE